MKSDFKISIKKIVALSFAVCSFVFLLIFMRFCTNIFGEPKYIFVRQIPNLYLQYDTSELEHKIMISKKAGFIKVEDLKEIVLKKNESKFVLNKLKYCKNLEVVQISELGGKYYEGIDNLDFLIDSKLKTLCITCKVEDWSSLKKIDTLENLDIGNVYGESKFSDISLISDFKNLKTLFIRTELNLSYEGIEKLNSVEEFSLYAPNRDIQQISKMHNLEELYARGGKVENFDHIKTLRNLRSLVINNTSVSDISVLKELKKIEYLAVEYTEIEDYSVLFELPNLKELRISEGELTNEELNRLKEKGVSVET